MINQTTEIDITIMVWIVIIIITVLVMILFVLFIIVIIKSKIHDSYHQGFKDSMNENVRYYKVIKDLTESYKIIYDMLYNEQTEMKVSIAECLIDYKDKLIEYSNK